MLATARPKSNLGIEKDALFGLKGLIREPNPKKKGISTYSGS